MKKVLFVFAFIVFLIYTTSTILASNKNVLVNENKPELVSVNVSGEVKKPGAYKVLVGTTLSFLLDMCELTEDSVVFNDGLIIDKDMSYEVLKRISSINLSLCSKDDLGLLPGIGAKKIEKILKKREEGFFKDWFQFKKELVLSEENLLKIMCLAVLM